jgi:hypothetical protein
MNRRTFLLLAIALALPPALARACILCTSPTSSSLARESGEAKLVIYGKVANARPGPDGISGSTDFAVLSLIKGDAKLVKGNTVTLPRYVPQSPGVTYLIFLDVINGQLDAYRNVVCTSDRIVQYLKRMPPITATSTPAERQARLKYTFEYLQDPELELSADAYKEWALASNQDVAAVAGQLDAAKLRRWLADPKTPTYCIGLYAYLLGSSGDASDAERLKQWVLQPPDLRMRGALDGLLAGYRRARPAESWELVRTVAAATDREFGERLALLRTLRFVHDVEGESARKEILSVCDKLLQQSDTFDLIVGLLHRWGWWERTDAIFAAYGTPGAQSIMTKRAIVRYALSCPEPAAKTFLEKLRKEEPALVKDVEKWLEQEK